MQLLHSHREPPVTLRLARDLVRSLKRGHPWVFADSLRECPPAPPGIRAVLLDHRRGREVARGFYDAHSPLAFRACTVEPGQALDEQWAEQRLQRALALRRALFDEQTTGFRLFNGEGDGLPGLICDVYGDRAVIQLDGPGPAGFWRTEGIARRLARLLSVRGVYEQGRGKEAGRALVGPVPDSPAFFLEQGVQCTADAVQGQKTGFFLDQRENRQRVGRLAAGRRVLNLFGYTGGFSVYAGLGGAEEALTVDMAAPALEMATYHWQLNGLPPGKHRVVRADVFEFLAQAGRSQSAWGVVVADPPSFASAKKAVPKALAAYRKLVAASATVTGPAGILAVASCSSQVQAGDFLQACQEGISRARRRATVLGIYGQPPDHPTPLPGPEFRYLKFVLMRLD